MAEITIEQAVALALQHHQAGRLQEAEKLYRQILARQPKHFIAMHYLGVIAHQAQKNDIAVELIRQAIALSPNYAEAYNNLGNVLRDRKQLDQAIAAFRRAIAIRPNYAEVFNNLGVVLKDNGQVDEAIAAYSRAIVLKPDSPEAHFNLGIILQARGQLDQTIAAYRQAIALRPNYADAHSNLGVALLNTGQLDQAIAAFRQAVILKPNFAEAHFNLGNALRSSGQLDEAIAAYRQAIALRPNYADAYNNLGVAMKYKRQLDESIAACRRAIAIRPNYAEAHNNLGNALRELGQLDESIAAFRQAIALEPDLSEAHNNLGNALKDQGQLDLAMAAYRAALLLKPDYPGAQSNLLYVMYFHPGYDAQAIYEEHRRWSQQHAEPLMKFVQPYTNDRNPERRLKIGYVSPDFHEHCQSLFTVPLFSHHNHRDFEIFCYSHQVHTDALTTRLKSFADVWRNVAQISDQQLSEIIRNDQIDILVDLTMHMANSRPQLFARKPAPVQVAWLAYPGTTGLSAMDYRLTDPWLDPPGLFDTCYSEESIRLPDTFWCYDPLTNEPQINDLPALQNGFITFGCLNNFCKINDGVLKLWAQVLAAVPNSRLILLVPAGQVRQWVQDKFREQGIDAKRVEFADYKPRAEYLKSYNRIDLGLDTQPYNGHTTSLDSLWMGVPVVTLVGQTVVGRAGWSQLCNIGLQQLAALTPDEFVFIAAELAGDLPRLRELRSGLRQRMQASPLMDASRFAHNIETAYRKMWHRYTGRETSLSSAEPS
jgi:protein O-GlcNAc transferase